MNIDRALAIITRGTAEITPLADLEKKLASGKKLQVKLGMDPTAPDLHLGHAVVLSKMREFQDLGHQALLLIGDFTAQIGDPTGRSKTRPPLTPEEIMHNQTTYLEQAGRILDTHHVRVVHNSTWLGPLSFNEIVKLCAKVTLARIIERDDFQKRMGEHQPIGFHELLYPLMQGYDSVALHADVELGGTDQTFNLLMGRSLQEHFGQEAQVIITMPLLEGIDGVQKMSKSYGNAIGIAESAAQAFGKIMSIPDANMWNYFLLLAHYTPENIAQLQQHIKENSVHPMKLKKELAHTIVSRFWSAEQANDAQQQFEALFQEKDYSQATSVELPQSTPQPIWIVDLLKLLSAVQSSSQAKRLIESNAISIDGTVITDFKATITCKNDMIIRAGKHAIYKIKTSL